MYKICKLHSRHFYTLSFLVDLETFLIFRRAGIYFGPLKLDSCVNSVKTGGRHFVQESWGTRMGLGPFSELSCPWGHLAINLWPSCTSPPGCLSAFFTRSHVLWAHASSKLPGSNEGNSQNLENVVAWLLNVLNSQHRRFTPSFVLLPSYFNPFLILVSQTNPNPVLRHPPPPTSVTHNPVHLFKCHMTVQVWRGLCPGQPPISDPN